MDNKRYYQSSWVKRYRALLIWLSIAILIPIIVALYFIFAYPRAHRYHLTEGFNIKPAINFYRLRLTNTIKQPIPIREWHDKWLLLYVLPSRCDDMCFAMLENLKRLTQHNRDTESHPIDVVIATFNDSRVTVLNKVLRDRYYHFIHVHSSMREFRRYFSHSRTARIALFEGMLYIVNPKGKVIMAYRNQTDFDSIARGLAFQQQHFAE